MKVALLIINWAILLYLVVFEIVSAMRRRTSKRHHYFIEFEYKTFKERARYTGVYKLPRRYKFETLRDIRRLSPPVHMFMPKWMLNNGQVSVKNIQYLGFYKSEDVETYFLEEY